MSEEVKSLQETDPELHELLVERCNHFVNQTYTYTLTHPCNNQEKQKPQKPFVRTEEKINRNDPCPHCLAEGITIKFKKCAKHCK